MIGGRYDLEREVGRGGMGAVWRATDCTLSRTVALKRISTAAAPAGDEPAPAVQRAEREARIAAGLSHPNLVAVFDLVTDDDDHLWMVMEYVEGTNLSQLIRGSGPLPLGQAAAILAQVADALSAAHGAGIVHRDVKPSNILLAGDGTAKLTDFGIARGLSDPSLTSTGLVTGSPAYLAPEVATGAAATTASDVWSLGASLCHALTGAPPYEQGDNVMSALFRVVHDDPPRPANAGWLLPVLEATMVKEPSQRWDAAEVRDALAAGPKPTTTSTATVAATAPATARAIPPAPPARTIQPRRPAAERTSPRIAPAPAAPAARARRGPGLAAIGAGVLALLIVAVVIFAVVTSTRDTPDTTATPGGASSSETSPGDGESTDAPDAGQIRAFVVDYLDLAPREPDQAFAMLTADFQAASGGLDGYRGFWGRVSNTKVESVSPDPDRLRVTYTYSYSVRGEGRRTETVTLQLAESGDGDLLIAGEA